MQCTILTSKSCVTSALLEIHCCVLDGADSNSSFQRRSTENSHVKTNMVHTLHRIKATGMQPLESFKEMLTKDEYRKCQTNPMRSKTWYQLTSEVFVSFLFRVSNEYILDYNLMNANLVYVSNLLESILTFSKFYQQDISEASDEAARKYIEETDKEDRSDAEITAVMREAAKAKAASFRGKFSKVTTVANPRLGDQFLDEVNGLIWH
jgi:hypothetical protein